MINSGHSGHNRNKYDNRDILRMAAGVRGEESDQWFQAKG